MAPIGRIASVSVIASAIRGRASAIGDPGKNACARSSMTSVRMKKSNASSVQPRNPASTAFRWLALSAAPATATVMRAKEYQKGGTITPSRFAKELAVVHVLRRVSVVGLALAVLSVPGAAQSRRFELDDFGRIVRVSDPQMAPDGKSVLVVVSR